MSKKFTAPSPEWFASQADALELRPHDTFLLNYPNLLRAFAALDPIHKPQDFVLGAHAVYGWMPTMLDLSMTDAAKVQKALKLLLYDNPNRTASVAALRTLEAAIGTVPKQRRDKTTGTLKLTARGKSIVGVSKLLHFLAPDRWPIWDRRVAAVWPLTGLRADGFWTYADALGAMAKADIKVTRQVNRKLSAAGYEKVGGLRAFEMLLFYGGKTF